MWQIRPAILLALVAATSARIPPLEKLCTLCGADVTATWKLDMSYTLSEKCWLPTVDELVDAFSGQSVYIAGDSTLRMPVQHFQSIWERCVNGTRECTHPRPCRQSSRPNPTEADHDTCGFLNYHHENMFPDGVVPNWWKQTLPHCLDNFLLNYEDKSIMLWFYEGGSAFSWFPRWVKPFKGIPDGALDPPVDDPTAAQNSPPVGVIMGAYLWHISTISSELPKLLEGYQKEMRSLLTAIAAEPSYKAWWSDRRVFWRMALPTDKCDVEGYRECGTVLGKAAIDTINAAAAKILTELTPGIVHLYSDPLAIRAPNQTAPDLKYPPSFRLHADGVHYKHDVQVVLMRGMLTAVLRETRDRALRGPNATITECPASSSAAGSGTVDVDPEPYTKSSVSVEGLRNGTQAAVQFLAGLSPSSIAGRTALIWAAGLTGALLVAVCWAAFQRRCLTGSKAGTRGSPGSS